MNIKKLNNTFLHNRLIPLLLIVFVFLSVNDAFAQKRKKKKKKKSPKLEMVFGLASTYDNNILKYSNKYLERFMNNEDQGRFHIKTYDDVIINPSLSTSYTFKVFGKLKSKVNLDVSSKNYVVNNIKTFNSFTLGFRQYLTKKASFKLYSKLLYTSFSRRRLG